MCGIVGAVGAGAEPIVDPTVLDRMCHVIRHRGPDDQGVYLSGPAALGMRRLSIIDLAGGHQPMANEDETVWLVFNGEIYNFKELRRDLEARGHVFRTSSDSECIVHAYEEYGGECFARLRGMFAIAIWDTRDRSLWLARDRMGKKPLFYSEGEKGIVFGSEMKSLLEVPWLRREVAPEAVQDFLILGYVPTPRSIFRDVRKIPPAHYLHYRLGASQIHRYWELPFEPKWTESEEVLAERLLELLDESVRIRLVSDVPFGAFLSGGLDSSVVVALMARHLAQPVKTFTIGFREEAFSEANDARVVANHVGTEHHEEIAEPNAVELLRDLVWHFDEPFGDSSAIPTFLVSRLAAKHVKMVLSGDGGDELFCGYDRYQKYRVVQRLRNLPFGLGARGLGAIADLLPGSLGRRVGWLAYRAGQPYPEGYLSGVALMTPEVARSLLRTPVDGVPFGTTRQHFLDGDFTKELDHVMAGDIRTYLLDDILVKVDRMTMACSLEGRAPLLDHELAEFAARLPLPMKQGPTAGKRLLRKVADRLLPGSTRHKRKQGFAIPLARWFREGLRELLFDTLLSRGFQERGVFDAATAVAFAEAHRSKAVDHGELLWLLLTFELWAARFQEGEPS